MKQVLLDLTFQLIIDDFLPFLGKFFGPYDQIFRNQQSTTLNSGKISVILYFYRTVDILQLGLILLTHKKVSQLTKVGIRQLYKRLLPVSSSTLDTCRGRGRPPISTYRNQHTQSVRVKHHHLSIRCSNRNKCGIQN